MKTIIAILLTLGVCASLSAQQVERCASHTIINNIEASYPGYKNSLDDMLRNAVKQSRIADKSHSNKRGVSGDKILRIPVVVHIVYTAPEENLPDSLIYNQIKVLNQAFRRDNADTATIRSEFRYVAADVGIEFFLATVDPSGQPTTGITRTVGSPTGFLGFSTNDEVKKTAEGGIDPWPTDKYLNIWVCNLLGGFGLLGYAYPPPLAVNLPAWQGQGAQLPSDSALQGVVMLHQIFGPNNPLALNGQFSSANGGMSCVHEVGHYLGLRHTWGDGGGFGGGGTCAEDDFINDTPETKDASQQTCSMNSNVCPSVCNVGPDYPDMIENYMDYSNDDCLSIFTWEQARTMRYVLEIYRPGLAQVSLGEIKNPLTPAGNAVVTTVTSNDSYVYYIGNPFYNFNNWNSVLIPGDTIYNAAGTEIVLGLCDSIEISPNTFYTTPAGDTIGAILGDTVYNYGDGSLFFGKGFTTGNNNPNDTTTNPVDTTNVGIGFTSTDDLTNNLSLFPNPTNGMFSLSIEGAFDYINVKILTLVGAEVSVVGDIKAGTSISVDETLEAGIYLVTGRINGKLVTKKLVVH